MDAFIGLLFALVGALAGGFLTRAILRARYGLARREVAAETNRLLNLFQALYTELSLTWEAYQNLAGAALEQAEEPDDLTFPGIFAASQHYFSVYDAAAAQLGALEPDSCRRLIDTYINLKAYFDELNTYRRLADRQRETRLKADFNLYEARQIRQELKNYLEYLQKRHVQVKGLVAASLEMLQEFVSLGRQGFEGFFPVPATSSTNGQRGQGRFQQFRPQDLSGFD
ncbi:MAG: hypothetical protein JRI59_07825 [Deltaproteobacteria bacterium]|nr:hypothetical protein [Deltaproteobacteria bacterium]